MNIQAIFSDERCAPFGRVGARAGRRQWILQLTLSCAWRIVVRPVTMRPVTQRNGGTRTCRRAGSAVNWLRVRSAGESDGVETVGQEAVNPVQSRSPGKICRIRACRSFGRHRPAGGCGAGSQPEGERKPLSAAEPTAPAYCAGSTIEAGIGDSQGGSGGTSGWIGRASQLKPDGSSMIAGQSRNRPWSALRWTGRPGPPRCQQRFTGAPLTLLRRQVKTVFRPRKRRPRTAVAASAISIRSGGRSTGNWFESSFFVTNQPTGENGCGCLLSRVDSRLHSSH